MNQRSFNSLMKNVRWVDDSVVVDLEGELDFGVSQNFQEAMLALLEKNPHRLIINLKDVTYMDSSGVASLVKLLSRSRMGQFELLLVNLNDRVRSIFEITKLDSVFDIRPNMEGVLE